MLPIFSYILVNTGLYMGVILKSPAILLAFGIGPTGPIAGGMFASIQGATIASGSIMAMAQSIAMTAPVAWGWLTIMYGCIGTSMMGGLWMMSQPICTSMMGGVLLFRKCIGIFYSK